MRDWKKCALDAEAKLAQANKALDGYVATLDETAAFLSALRDYASDAAGFTLLDQVEAAASHARAAESERRAALREVESLRAQLAAAP